MIIFQNCQKLYLTGQSFNIVSTLGQFKSRKTKVVLFFLSNSTQIFSLEAFIIIYVCQFLKLFVCRKLVYFERKDNFKHTKLQFTEG